MSQMNWFEDEEKKFEDLSEGFYSATLTNATLDETKEEPRLSIEFTLSTRRKVWLNLKFSDKQKKFFNWQMRELGVYDRAKELAIAGKPVSHAFLDALGEIIGVTCEVEITYRDWQGKRYQSVRVESCGIVPTPEAPKVTATARPATTQAARPAVKNFAPGVNATTPVAPKFDAAEELPDFMR